MQSDLKIICMFHFSYFTGPLSLTIPLWVGAMSTGGGFSHRWRKQRVLDSSWPCNQYCWL